MSKDIATTIKELREERKLSKARLARESGISDAYLVQIEKGDRTASDAVLRNLAKALRVPAHRLLIPSGHYDAELVAKATEMAASNAEMVEAKEGIELTDDQRERLLAGALDYLSREADLDEYEADPHAQHAAYLQGMRQYEPFKLSDEEFWDWDTTTAWAPEGWNDLSSRDRNIVQQLITRMVELQDRR